MTFTVFVGMVGGAGTTSAAFTYALAASQNSSCRVHRPHR